MLSIPETRDTETTRAERALVGLMIIHPSIIDRCEIELHDYRCVDSDASQIWPVLCELRRGNFPMADLTSLAVEVRKRGIAPASLARVANEAGLPSNENFYIHTLTKQRRKRRLLKLAADALEKLDREDCDVDSVADSLSSGLASIPQLSKRKSRAGDIMMDVLALSEETQQPVRKVFSGISTLDLKMGGFRDGQLIVLAARPSVGKSALAAQMAINAAKDGAKTLFISLEMSAQETVARAMAFETGINMQHILDGTLQIGDVNRLKGLATAYQNEIPLYVEDRSNLTMHRLEMLVKQYSAKQRLGFVVVDYIGLVSSDDSRKSAWEVTEKVSKGLKQLAKSEKVPILALSQLNRDSEKEKQIAIPTLAQLRNSGSVEQDADAVLLLHRESRQSKDATLILAKGRNCGTGKLSLEYNGPKYEFIPAMVDNEFSKDF
ncbi:Replicative DNA helicase [Pirellula sp. SH-Sr6A]|uniref:replicative DNA helicase n=1 Tax=Pirellula sp. SH-Sr6A TaxID=1632865 RepID=UPI00078CFB64|nr:DnaB-like helicase C-terminal domain-containing protein [Pirellula sp. SH-Sr6A]AMV30865.1 Replicative DNA helicase [Pirellula sp. SH-Sr6A]AMV34372.1 Replicative DNA helicase [Pirellula sp. SH-Sr6A]